ncbi:hypothetical protein BDY19DRAFT_989781 [Irpex rosettiformis]|uniref:Uncharacterized protein n=1 Tax=Irpex rosettiformis TaxID=378272 RepID=A0ACB8UFQ5_9APHY|nr:hypothetical protein BDY19DRAFT_989781 [Irpex rosettiformis]
MPPKKPPAKLLTQRPKSQALVTTGPKEVVQRKTHSKRDADGHKPTTARALVLRNGKYGSMGTGEVILATKMSGREKLELLAEDLVASYAQALATPFNGQKAIKIAEAQYTACLDEIENLRDPILFYHAIKSEAEARKPQLPPVSGKKKQQRKDPMTDSNFIASVVSSRIHNTYMLASAWRLVGLTLTQEIDTDKDSRIRDILGKNPQFRAQYLVLYDMVNILVSLGQQKFAQLATTAPHWSQYFQVNQNRDLSSDQPEYTFSWEQIKGVHKSFLDSIVVELCLPASAYPKQILIHILHEAIDETPRDAKRFPQELWDAMGDLSSTVQLLELLESPLLGPEGEQWKKEERKVPEDFEKWVDAQLFSERASREYSNFQNMLIPIDTELVKAHVVETIWKYVNLNYQGVCGLTVDTLWGLDDLKYRKPSWHARMKDSEKKTETDGPFTSLMSGGMNKAKSGNGKKTYAITDGHESECSMPSLMTISDSSEEMDDRSDSSFDDSDEDEEEESEDEDDHYDEDEEDHLREMLREAMDMAAADPDFYNPRSEAAYFKEAAEEKQGNAFIKLLGSLRGRMFTANPNLKSSKRTEPREQYIGPKPPASAYTPVQPRPKAPPKAKPTPAPQKPGKAQSKHATVEEVSDEDEPTTTPKKKKKKPKKKKKKTVPTPEETTAGPDRTNEVQQSPPPAVAPTPTPLQKQKQTPATPKTAKTPSVKSTASSSTIHPYASTASLPLPTEQAAQSARSYIQKEGLKEKVKVKTRSDQHKLFDISEKKAKRSIFSRFGGKKENEGEPEPKETGDKHGFFTNMTKKTKAYMHQLLHTAEDEKQGIAPLKWEHFLKVMREMGFSYDPSTAGSSVRFDPPDPRDRPITFHKPHPDPTLHPILVRDFGRRLKNAYGWSEADFYTKVANAA